jgi:molybdopterin-guanine dinucleotide biosynthesis protein A
MIDALVLSGGEIEAERFHGLDPAITRKAHVPILGRAMVEWVVRGLRRCPRIGRITVVGDASLDTPGLRGLDARVTPEAGDIAQNLRAGLAALPGAEQVLALSGDLPLLSPEALKDLFTHAPAADVIFPYVAREDVCREFADRVWVFSQLPEGAFTGSSTVLFRPDALLANWRWVEAFLNARRRSPLGLALMIGPSLALKYGLGRLHIEDVERRLSALLHLKGRGYQSRFAELAMDVDKLSDIALAERVLMQRDGQAPGLETCS